MKFSYAQEMFLRMCSASFIIIMAILFLTSCSNEQWEQCKVIAKIDYNMDNPACYGGWPSSSDCVCSDKICKEFSCINSPEIYFDLKNLEGD